jgi:hypothetical protein
MRWKNLPNADPEPDMSAEPEVLRHIFSRHGDVSEQRHRVGLLLAGKAIGDLASKTTCITLLAGAGTRWRRTLEAAKQRFPVEKRVLEFPGNAPRGLFPVRNHIDMQSEFIPMAAYALDAFRNLGRHCIVVRGWEDAIQQTILKRLQISRSSVDFCTQREGPMAKVLGHGDATLQAYGSWKDSEFVMVNFAGDANSPYTALVSLLALASLSANEEKVDMVLPVAEIPSSAYPIYLDSQGFPRNFGHDKLGDDFGTKSFQSDPLHRSRYANVGIRLYRKSALARVIDRVVSDFWIPDLGYDIPGNDPEAHEFALDNVDAMIAEEKGARILAIARPEELTPAKSFDELERFERATAEVRKDWNNFRESLDSQHPGNSWTRDRVDDPRTEDRPKGIDLGKGRNDKGS